MKHFIHYGDYSPEELKSILMTALDIKQNPDKYQDSLKNKKLYMLFEKTSTRTFLSFASGFEEMGGRCYSQNYCDSNFAVGDIASEIQYVGMSTDIIMARLKDHELSRLFARYSPVPFINGCDNTYHPCQGLADFLTIYEIFGTFDKKLLYIGAQNNVFYSLVQLAGKLGGQIFGLTPLTNKSSISDDFLEYHQNKGCYIPIDPSITKTELQSHIAEMDLVYTDTWIDMEFFNDPAYQQQKEETIAAMLPFQLNAALFDSANPVILHDMPIHIGYEITQETAAQNMKTILLQADNRKHAQKALMLHLLSD